MKVLAQRESVERRALVADVIDQEEFSHDTLLRRVEHLRKSISRSRLGDPGMFAGFADLSLLPESAVPEDCPVFLQVFERDCYAGSHDIEFVAIACAPFGRSSLRSNQETIVVARGSGRAMTLDRTS